MEDQLRRAWPALQARSRLTLDNAPPDSLCARWSTLMRELGVGAAASSRWWRVVRDHYANRDRHYHTLAHLRDMFRLRDAFTAALAAPSEVDAAIFFHDIIYDATQKDNETRSAELWERFAAEQGVPADVSERVAGWIRRTASHMAGPAAGDLAFLLDFDLAVLGRAQPAYAEYTQQVRMEYHHVEWGAFVKARRDVMTRCVRDYPLVFRGGAHRSMPPTPLTHQVPAARVPLLHAGSPRAPGSARPQQHRVGDLFAGFEAVNMTDIGILYTLSLSSYKHFFFHDHDHESVFM